MPFYACIGSPQNMGILICQTLLIIHDRQAAINTVFGQIQ